PPLISLVTVLTETINEISKLSNKIEMNHDSHLEEILPPSSPEGKVKETMHNDFWDHLREQLSATPPDFGCALDLLNEIKEIFLSLLLPCQNRLRSEIEEALVADFLKQEAEHGTLDVSSLSQYILNIMTLLCAPVRDEAVQTLEDTTDAVGLLRGIFQVLGLMKMDMVSYTIQSLQPQLQEHSIQYKRAEFQEQLDQQPGFLNLLLWDPENEEFPETLQMDRTRLEELEAQLQQLTILASVLLVASSFSGSVLCGSPQFVDKLKCLTKALLEEFNPRTEDAMQTLSEQLQNITKKENCVRSVIGQRIHLFLKCCLLLGVQHSLLDLSGGLTFIEAELAELGQKFINLTHHNQQVFGPYYTKILKTLIPPAQTLKTQGEFL
ncbi:T-complex protein 11-like protein, partial [Heterocephalus glaber]